MKDAPQLPPLQLDKQTPETPIDDRDSVPLSSTQLEQQNRQTAVQDREHAPQPTELRQPTDLARHSDAPQLPPLQLNSDPIATSITPSVALPATATVFSKGLVPINDPSLPAPPSLEDQRNVLVDEVASEAKARKTEPLGDEAKAVFKAAGMEVERGSLEVETRYLKPVVQVSIHKALLKVGTHHNQRAHRDDYSDRSTYTSTSRIVSLPLNLLIVLKFNLYPTLILSFSNHDIAYSQQ